MNCWGKTKSPYGTRFQTWDFFSDIFSRPYRTVFLCVGHRFGSLSNPSNELLG